MVDRVDSLQKLWQKEAEIKNKTARLLEPGKHGVGIHVCICPQLSGSNDCCNMIVMLVLPTILCLVWSMLLDFF